MASRVIPPTDSPTRAPSAKLLCRRGCLGFRCRVLAVWVCVVMLAPFAIAKAVAQGLPADPAAPLQVMPLPGLPTLAAPPAFAPTLEPEAGGAPAGDPADTATDLPRWPPQPGPGFGPGLGTDLPLRTAPLLPAPADPDAPLALPLPLRDPPPDAAVLPDSLAPTEDPPDQPPAAAAPVAVVAIPASEAHVRWLDKLTGRTSDLWLRPGEGVMRDHLRIRMDECRVPAAAPASDAFAYLVIHDSRANQRLFAGWMIASSPAVSAMDHPRYDVWLMGCATEAGSGQ